MSPPERLRILHCFRAPVGGVFRHVRDLALEHSRAGHEVGFICDSLTGGSYEDALFESVRPHLKLGITRLPIPRSVGPGDLLAAWRAASQIRARAPHVLHGHGAKGGAFARMIGWRLRLGADMPVRLYSPHGGSLHYSAADRSGRFYFTVERMLERWTEAVVFVSEFERASYGEKIGMPRPQSVVIPNGLRPDEFIPVEADADAADFLFVGTLRDLKGPDVFIGAIGEAAKRLGRPVSAVIVGDGEDAARCRAMIDAEGLAGVTRMRPAMPAREAFRLGRVMCVPSRAESMPYIVLEALAAGMPLIASRVGGIPEIFGADCPALVQPGSISALAETMTLSLEDPAWLRSAMPGPAAFHQRFSVERMADAVLGLYRQCLNGTVAATANEAASNVS